MPYDFTHMGNLRNKTKKKRQTKETREQTGGFQWEWVK